MPPISPAGTVPNVLVTIKPIHSLVAGVMHGVAEPRLLMKSNQSLHHYALRPSERRYISQAELIFWVSPQLEAFLPRLLLSNNVNAKSVSLIDSKNIVRLNNVYKHQDKKHDALQIDPHIWLSTQNAIAMVDEITRQLVKINPQHEKQYVFNKIKLSKKISDLSTQLKKQLSHSEKPYITFHNATGYFENEFKLQNAGIIQSNSEIQPSALHIRKIIQTIKQRNITCLFYNQGEKPRLITSLQNQTHAKSYAFDPVGVNIQTGENAWFEIMENVASNLSACLNNSLD